MQSQTALNQMRADIARQTQEFINAGGRIQRLPYLLPHSDKKRAGRKKGEASTIKPGRIRFSDNGIEPTR